MEPMKNFCDLAEKLIDALVCEADYEDRDEDVQDILEIIKTHQKEKKKVLEDMTIAASASIHPNGEWIHY